MADPPTGPDFDDTGVGPDREATTGAPRWVKAFGIIAVVLVLLLVVMLLTGHGPARHTGGHAPPSAIAEGGVQRS